MKAADKAQILKEAQEEFGKDDGEDEQYDLDYEDDDNNEGVIGMS